MAVNNVRMIVLLDRIHMHLTLLARLLQPHEGLLNLGMVFFGTDARVGSLPARMGVFFGHFAILIIASAKWSVTPRHPRLLMLILRCTGRQCAQGKKHPPCAAAPNRQRCRWPRLRLAVSWRKRFEHCTRSTNTRFAHGCFEDRRNELVV